MALKMDTLVHLYRVEIERADTTENYLVAAMNMSWALDHLYNTDARKISAERIKENWAMADYGSRTLEHAEDYYHAVKLKE